MAAPRSSLRHSSLNLHGFNNGGGCLVDLCSVSDVILLQEHWLAPDCLHLLSTISDDFVYFANSAMTLKLATGVFHGRPFGGIGVLVNRSLAKSTYLVVNGERLIVVKVGNVYIANVYLPNSSSSSRGEIVSDICSQIESNVDFNGANRVIIGGDFNLEFTSDKSCCKDLNSFI